MVGNKFERSMSENMEGLITKGAWRWTGHWYLESYFPAKLYQRFIFSPRMEVSLISSRQLCFYCFLSSPLHIVIKVWLKQIATKFHMSLCITTVSLQSWVRGVWIWTKEVWSIAISKNYFSPLGCNNLVLGWAGEEKNKVMKCLLFYSRLFNFFLKNC